MSQLPNTLRLKPYSKKELAKLYGVSDRTFVKWLTPHIDSIGTRQGWYYTIAQVEMIFAKLGKPVREYPISNKEQGMSRLS